MKLVCNCGNEYELIEDDANRWKEHIAKNGSHIDLERSGFDWSEHDEYILTCYKCGKKITW